MITVRTVDSLKSEGLCFIAGQLAKAIGCSRSYGCHFGMRSTLERDRAEFYRGFDL